MGRRGHDRLSRLRAQGAAALALVRAEAQAVIERYTVTRDGRLRNKRTGELVPDDNRPIGAPQIQRDFAPYRSPVGSGMIEGRAAQREDLKRHDCRIAEVGEPIVPGGKPWRPHYRNPSFALPRGLPLGER